MAIELKFRNKKNSFKYRPAVTGIDKKQVKGNAPQNSISLDYIVLKNIKLKITDHLVRSVKVRLEIMFKKNESVFFFRKRYNSLDANL